MPLITTTFYSWKPVLHLIPSEEEMIAKFNHIPSYQEDFHIGYMITSLLSDIYYRDTYGDGEWVTTREVYRLEDSIKHFNEEFPGAVPELHEIIKSIRNSKITVETEMPPMTTQQEELVSLFSEYCHLVHASHSVSQHGKSWEPLIRLMMNTEGSLDYLSMRSYQGGDEFSTSGNIESVIEDVKSHLMEVSGDLLRGTTNSNPFVMDMMHDQTELTREKYISIRNYDPNPYHGSLIMDGAFLPVAFPGKKVESSGYPDKEYDLNQASVSLGYDVFFDLNKAVGINSIETEDHVNYRHAKDV